MDRITLYPTSLRVVDPIGIINAYLSGRAVITYETRYPQANKDAKAVLEVSARVFHICPKTNLEGDGKDWDPQLNAATCGLNALTQAQQRRIETTIACLHPCNCPFSHYIREHFRTIPNTASTHV